MGEDSSKLSDAAAKEKKALEEKEAAKKAAVADHTGIGIALHASEEAQKGLVADTAGVLATVKPSVAIQAQKQGLPTIQLKPGQDLPAVNVKPKQPDELPTVTVKTEDEAVPTIKVKADPEKTPAADKLNSESDAEKSPGGSSYYKVHFAERDEKKDMQLLGIEAPLKHHQAVIPYGEFIDIRKRQIDKFAEMAKDFENFKQEARKAVEKVVNESEVKNKYSAPTGTWEKIKSKLSSDQETAADVIFAKENGLFAAELNEVIDAHRKTVGAEKDIGMSVGTDDADELSAEDVQKKQELAKKNKEAEEIYINNLVEVVARRRLLAKYREMLYRKGKGSAMDNPGYMPGANEYGDKAFLFNDIQPENTHDTDSFEVYQTLALMELYSGVTMEFDTKGEKGEEEIDHDNFKINYFDEKVGKNITLVTGKKIPGKEAKDGEDIDHGKISWQADVTSKDPKIWDKALCIIVDQRKRLMNRTWGLADQSFPITGKAHPEKMLRLYQLAMMNNLQPTLNPAQLDHIMAHDKKHGTEYAKVLHHLMISKESVWPGSVNNELEHLQKQHLQPVNAQNIAAEGAAIKDARGGELWKNLKHGKKHWEHHNIVDELKNLHIKNMEEKFRAENLGKTPAELSDEAKKLTKLEVGASETAKVSNNLSIS